MNTTKPTYIVLGYGIPDNILEDKNYNAYLPKAFDVIHKAALVHDEPCDIIVCGGNTDMVPPYKRTEAGAMHQWFDDYLLRPTNAKVAHLVRIIEDNQSYSTLENLLNTDQLTSDKTSPVVVFCEYTRIYRVSALAKEIFKERLQEVIAIDFETSPQRYVDPKIILEKEQKALKHDVWAMKNAENMLEHSKLYRDKIDFIRAHPDDPDIIKKWWESVLIKEWDKIENS